MSDGDNATPGPHTPGTDSDKWITRSAEPTPGAAPWERAADSQQDDADGGANYTPGRRRRGRRANSTDEVSVADLFARLTGDVPEALQPAAETSTADESDDWPPAEPTEPAVPEPTAADQVDPPTTPVPTAYATQLPDLDQLPQARRYQPGATDDYPDSGELDAVAPLPPRRAPLPRSPQIPAKATAGKKTPGKAPRQPTPQNRRSRRRALLAGRSVAAMSAVCALLLTGGAWQWTATKNNRMNTIAALDLDSRDIVDPNAQFGDENFLIVGTDTRAGENSAMGAGDTSDAGGSRSDSIILVNIPANRERVVAVSFPRDLAITPLKCDAWNATTGEYGPVYLEDMGGYGPEEWYTETKLNSAYSYGGPKCLVKAIQKISGLSINRFMAVDFAGFAKMVDALGGVEVCSTVPLEDYELGTVLARAGRQTVDGSTALDYVRARQVTTEVNGDYGRIKRQQLFLSSLMRSLISKDTFFSLSKLNNVVNMFINDSSVDNVSTKDLVALGQSLQGVSAGRITFITVPTTGYADEWGNEQPRTQDIKALFTAIINDEPLPGENDTNETTTPLTSSSDPTATTATQADSESTTDAASGATAAKTTGTTELVNSVTIEPEDVSVHVSNSTSQLGLGAATSSQLRLYGFNVDTPDDYSEALSATTVRYSPGNEQAAVTVAAALGTPKIERMTGLGSEVRVILGADNAMVTPPSPTGTAVTVPVVHRINSTPTELPEDLTVTNGADVSCE